VEVIRQHDVTFLLPCTNRHLSSVEWLLTRSRKSVWGVAWPWSFGLCWRRVWDQWPCMPIIHHVRSAANAANFFPSVCV